MGALKHQLSKLSTNASYNQIMLHWDCSKVWEASGSPVVLPKNLQISRLICQNIVNGPGLTSFKTNQLGTLLDNFLADQVENVKFSFQSTYRKVASSNISCLEALHRQAFSDQKMCILIFKIQYQNLY